MDNPLEPLTEAAIEAVAKNASKAKDALTTEGVKRWNAEKNAISDANIAKTETASQMLTDKMKEIGVPEEYAKKALINELETIVNKQSILDKIWAKTKRILKGTPQDDKHAEQNIEEISDDWLNRFRESACQKSSEEAQELFSKVLAGEIRKPGSFSLKALTTLADMDQKVALYFKAFCSLCLVDLDNPKMYLLTQSKSHFKIKDARIPIIKDPSYDVPPIGPPYSDDILINIKNSKLIYQMYGLRDDQFKLLMEHNLIVDHTNIDYYTFWYNNDIWGFLSPHANMPGPSEDQKYVKLTGYALTNVGIELFHIVEPNTPPGYWERISVFIQDFYYVNLYKYPKPPKKSVPEASTDQNTLDKNN